MQRKLEVDSCTANQAKGCDYHLICLSYSSSTYLITLPPYIFWFSQVLFISSISCILQLGLISPYICCRISYSKLYLPFFSSCIARHCSSCHSLALSVTFLSSLFNFLQFPSSSVLCFPVSTSRPFSLSSQLWPKLSVFFVSCMQCIVHYFPSLNPSTDSIFQHSFQENFPHFFYFVSSHSLWMHM